MKKSYPLKWIFHKSRKYIPILCGLIAAAVFSSYVGVSFSVASKELIDAATGVSQVSVLRAGIKLAVLLAVQLLIQIVYTRIHVKTGGKIALNMQSEIYRDLLDKDYITVSSIHSGEILNRLTGDVSFVAEKIVEILPSAVSLIATVLFSFFALYRVDRFFAFCCLGFGPVALGAAYIYKKRVKTLHLACRESDGKVRSFIQETIQNLLVIKAFQKESVISGYASSLQRENYKLNVKRATVGIFANVLFFLASTVGYYAALGFSIYRISIGTMTFGTMTAILALVSQIQSPFREIAGILPQCYQALASAQRLMELNNLPQENDTETVAPVEAPTAITVEHVSYAYDTVMVLSDVSFTVNKGETVALCGVSGSGKSTLTRIILSVLTPESGVVKIHFSEDLSVTASKATRALFSYVPQGNMILSGTLLENITFLDKTPDMNRVTQAVRVAQLAETVNTLPNGLETVLGEHGHGLSEGQVQRVAVARALYADKPIILLDEATSSLDISTEAALLSAIRNDTNKTCILISHRHEVMNVCDKTYLLQDGSLQELK